MRIDTQRFLDMVENIPGSMAFFDLEASGLRGDYNSIICGSIIDFKEKEARNWAVSKIGRDKTVVQQVKEALESAEVWITYYGKGFDIKMINTRLLRWGLEPVEPRPHLDLYFSLKEKLLTARKSQGHLLSWLGTPEQKMGVSATVWSDAAANKENISILVERCASDVRGLRDLYSKTRHLVKEITA